MSRTTLLLYFMLTVFAFQQLHTFYNGLYAVKQTTRTIDLPVYTREGEVSKIGPVIIDKYGQLHKETCRLFPSCYAGGPVTSGAPPVPVCSIPDRLQYLREHCPSRHQNSTMAQFLDQLSPDALRSLVKEYIVNEEHKVIACLHFKVGTSTWNSIFINNSINRPPEKWMFKTKYIETHYKYSDFGIHMLASFPVAQIKQKLLTYYKFMVVRHPLARILAVYKDKLRNDNSYYCHTLGAKILSIYRPYLAKDVIAKGQGVHFEELVKYINRGGKDEHWAGPYARQCRPCDIHYDQIVKLETFKHDAAPITDRMRKRGLHTANNRHRDEPKGVKDVLFEYQNVSAKSLSALVTRYKSDFINFGYTFSRNRDFSLDTNCRASSKTGKICC